MPIVLPPLFPWLKANWFLAAALFVIAGDIAVVQDMRDPSPQFIELAVLADLALVVPLLYLACYRAAGRKAIIKAVGLVCFGIWLTSKIVPAEDHDLINALWPVRYLGLAALATLEIAVLWSLVAIYKSIFNGASESQAAERFAKAADVPPWVARLMAKEALFWHRLWLRIHRLFK